MSPAIPTLPLILKSGMRTFLLQVSWCFACKRSHEVGASDEFLGQVTIPLDSIPVGVPHDQYYTLQQKKAKDKISGELHLYIYYLTDKRSMTPDDFELLALLGKGTFGKASSGRLTDMD
jgi:hypothetical protein